MWRGFASMMEKNFARLLLGRASEMGVFPKVIFGGQFGTIP
jgi:hypothetical protein